MSIDNDAPGTFPIGTESKPYAPMPGDIVAVDCRGIAAKYDQHGTRVGVLKRLDYAHGCDVALVLLPGWEGVLYLDPDWLTLLYRKPAP
jgi:hypothetical protein